MKKVNGSLKYQTTNYSDYISNFGKFSNLDLEDQRTILYSKGGKENVGEFLSVEEKQALADCLKVNKMPILSDQEINELVYEAYGSRACDSKQFFDRPGASGDDIPPFTIYGIPSNGKAGGPQPVRINETPTAYDSQGHFDYQEAKFKYNMQILRKIVQFMKARNNKEHKQRYKDYYDQIVSEMTGKKKQTSMYQIRRQMAETQNQEDINDKLKASKNTSVEPNEEQKSIKENNNERRSELAITPLGSSTGGGSPYRRKIKRESSILTGTQDSMMKRNESLKVKKITKEVHSSVPAEASKRLNKRQKSKESGIQLSQPRIFFDEEKVKFKLLANFLNCYSEKLQLSCKEEETED